MNKEFRTYLLSLLVILLTNKLPAQPIIYTGETQTHIGKSVEILKVAENNLTIKDVVNHKGFIKSNEVVPNLGISSSTFWIRFSVLNKSSSKNLKLLVSNPLIDTVELYTSFWP